MSPFLPSELLPYRVSFAPDQPITIEARNISLPGEARIWHLGEEIARVKYDGDGQISFPPVPPGGYGVELVAGEDLYSTALEVSENRRSRMRYGFVASYDPSKDVQGVVDLARRLHLNAIQFYDWAFRHAGLMGGGENYHDALGQPIALKTVRDLILALHEVGADALGYAAVYAVGRNEWERWQHLALVDGSGKTYGLGDFLNLIDPGSPDWLEHFTDELKKASSLGFDGFHLDQYGYPKLARRADGAIIDLSAAFCRLIETVRAALPGANLVFNNVNDFPTSASATTSQDALYIEPWEPQSTLSALAKTVSNARAAAAALGSGSSKPVVIAAYQHVYDNASADIADSASALTMATLFSHGATQLLAGEAANILVDPYYVRNHAMAPSTAKLLKRWYDFVVAQDELLMAPDIIDVTNSYAGPYNDEIDVSYDGVEVSEEAKAGTIWRRITRAGDRLVVHIINLCSQSDILWDAPRAPLGQVGPGYLRFRHVFNSTPAVFVGDPDIGCRLIKIPVIMEGDYARAELPEPGHWLMVVVER